MLLVNLTKHKQEMCLYFALLVFLKIKCLADVTAGGDKTIQLFLNIKCLAGVTAGGGMRR